MRAVLLSLAMVVVTVGCVASAPEEVIERSQRYSAVVDLPAPERVGPSSVEEALRSRRSVREFDASPLTIEEIGQLLWAAQGITDQAGHRTAPSAGARYPLELYALTATEVMHYLPSGHRIEVGPADDPLPAIGQAAFGQDWIGSAPIVFVLTGVVARTEIEYGAVADELVDREAGHAAQNLLLQATALELASVPVGGFDPEEVSRLLALRSDEDVLYLIPVGRWVSPAAIEDRDARGSG